MAVPSSGQLNMLKLAREKVYDDYNSSSSITSPISMYDLVNGGNTNGSGNSYDTTNQQSASRPDTVISHAFSEWYRYDHDAQTLVLAAFSPSIQHASAYHFGSTTLTHASKAAACASTNTLTHCVFISWNGTIGNGTVINKWCNVGVAEDGVGGRWMVTGASGSDAETSGACGSTNFDSNKYVFQLSTSGVVSNFGTCLTSYSSSVMGVFLANCNFNGTLNTMNQTYYHDGSGTYPTAGDICYSDSAGTSVLAAGYYTIPPSSSGVGNRTYIKISTNQGVVDSGYPQTC